MSIYVLTIGGVDRTAHIRAETIRVEDILNEAPNLCYFSTNVTIPSAPVVGQDVLLGITDVTLGNRLFGGTITTVEQNYDELRRNLRWDVTCQDYTYLFNRRRPIVNYVNQSATDVVLSLVGIYAPTFSTVFVNQGLPLVTISFDGTQDLMSCIVQVANLVGAYAYVDYGKNLHFFITEPAVTGAFDTSVYDSDIFEVFDSVIVDPDPIDENSAADMFGVRNLIAGRDISQIRTTVFVKGGGTSVIAPTGQTVPIPSNFDIIPVNDSTAFQNSGQAITDDAQVFSYTGVFTTYHGATTGTDTPGGTVIPAPTGGPVPTLGSGAGNLIGTYSYKVAFGNGSGETLPSPQGGSIATIGFAPPPQPQLIQGSLTGSRLTPGNYNYVVTYVTAQGQTLQSNPSTITVGQLSSGGAVSGPGSAPGVQAFSHGNVLPGSYNYSHSFTTQDGETVPGPISSITIQSFNRPTPQFNGSFAAGGLNGDGYSYKCTVVTAEGESVVGFASGAISNVFSSPGGAAFLQQFLPGAGLSVNTTYLYGQSWFHSIYGETAISWSGSAQFTTPNVGSNFVARVNFQQKPTWATGVRIYRSNVTLGTGFGLVREVSDFSTQFDDRVADSGITQFGPKDSKRCGAGVFMLIPASGEPGVLARRIYRNTANFGTDYFLVAELQNDIQQNIVDVAFDDAIRSGKRPPASDVVGRQVNITSLSSPGGTVIRSRRIYRSKVGGGTLFMIGEIKDATTTGPFVDNMPDSNLGTGVSTTAPGSSTSGGSFMPIVVVPTGPTGVVARRVYRTESNGALYKFLIEIPGNNQFNYSDNIPDVSLGGDTPPLINTAGGASVNLIGIQTGPSGITQRVIYRNKAADQNAWFYAGTILNNTDTTYTDNQSDGSLGRPPLAVASLTLGAILNNFVVAGAKPGDTTLQITNVLDANNLPSRGWIKVGSQQIFFGFRSGTQLSSIPATGFGSITAQISAGTAGQPIDILTGVSGLNRALKSGANINIWVRRDDSAAQAVMAAIEGGDGIHEFTVADSSLITQSDITNRALAELAQFKSPLNTITYTCRDIKTKSGRNVNIILGAPTNITITLQIQQVTITRFHDPNVAPLFTVKAATVKFGIQDLIRRVVIGQGISVDHP